MLSQYHTGCTQQTGNDDKHAEPVNGIVGEGQQRTRHTADGRRVRTDFPPLVDDSADHLNDQRGHHDTRHEMRDAQQLHEIVADAVADNTDDIGHHATLLHTQFYQRPSLIAAIEMDEEGGKQYGAHIHQSDDLQFIGPRQQTQVTEYEQQNESYHGKVEGVENGTHQLGAQNDMSLSHLISFSFLQ